MEPLAEWSPHAGRLCENQRPAPPCGGSAPRCGVRLRLWLEQRHLALHGGPPSPVRPPTPPPQSQASRTARLTVCAPRWLQAMHPRVQTRRTTRPPWRCSTSTSTADPRARARLAAPSKPAPGAAPPRARPAPPAPAASACFASASSSVKTWASTSLPRATLTTAATTR